MQRTAHHIGQRARQQVKQRRVPAPCQIGSAFDHLGALGADGLLVGLGNVNRRQMFRHQRMQGQSQQFLLFHASGCGNGIDQAPPIRLDGCDGPLAFFLDVPLQQLPLETRHGTGGWRFMLFCQARRADQHRQLGQCGGGVAHTRPMPLFLTRIAAKYNEIVIQILGPNRAVSCGACAVCSWGENSVRTSLKTLKKRRRRERERERERERN